MFFSYPEALQLLGVLEGTRRPRPPQAPTSVPDEIEGLPAIAYPRSLELLDAALGGAERVARLLDELRTLDIQLCSTTLTPLERARLARRYFRTMGVLEQSVLHTRFGDIPLLEGRSLYLFLPPPGGETLRVALPDMTLSALALSNPADTLTNAQAALDLLDAAIAQVSLERSALAVRRLELVDGSPSGGLIEAQQQLERMRPLAVQASAGYLSTSDRAPLDLFFQSHVASLVETLEVTRFEGWDLTAGATVCLQAAPPGAALVFLELPNLYWEMFRAARDMDVRTLSNADYALSQIDDALARIAHERERIEHTRAELERGFLHLR
ncbi:MAG: hypothetical protein EXS08_05140 [Planctomycetes bacterium]|nr:hypothetical protein [Planctomycetota bacterium]